MVPAGVKLRQERGGSRVRAPAELGCGQLWQSVRTGLTPCGFLPFYCDLSELEVEKLGNR